MEYTMADPHLARRRLQRLLEALSERQQLALRRNRALRHEFLRLGAHMDTRGWRCIREIEWYGREIKNLLSLGEGGSSAGGDKEGGSSEQVLQAGTGSSRAVPGELLGCSTPAASGTGGLGSPEGLCPETGSTAGESEEGAAGHRELAASEEGSEQLSSAPLRPGHVPGAKPGLSRQGSSAELPVPAEEEEEARPSIPSTQQEQGRDARALEPLDSSAPARTTQREENNGKRAGRWNTGTELSELCHALQLLQDLVERTSPQHRALYQGQPSELPRLAQGDLEVMEAMVLQQLQQAVSPGIGSLLEEHSRDTEALRTLLGHHGLFLRQHRVRLPEGVAEMFEQLLASAEEGQDSQVLGEALPGEPGTVQSDESSLLLPSIPTNGGEGKQRELAQREAGRDPRHGSPEGSSSPGTHLESSSESDGSTPPSSRTELRKEAVAAIKSKAFWGESEESSSELEAALRPQTHGADSDDFDDFYD